MITRTTVPEKMVNCLGGNRFKWLWLRFAKRANWNFQLPIQNVISRRLTNEHPYVINSCGHAPAFGHVRIRVLLFDALIFPTNALNTVFLYGIIILLLFSLFFPSLPLSLHHHWSHHHQHLHHQHHTNTAADDEHLYFQFLCTMFAIC